MSTWHWIVVAYLCIGIGLAGGIYLQSSQHDKPTIIGTAATIVFWPAVGALLGLMYLANKAWR